MDRILYTVIPVLDSSSWCEKLKVLLQKQTKEKNFPSQISGHDHHRTQALLIRHPGCREQSRSSNSSLSCPLALQSKQQSRWRHTGHCCWNSVHRGDKKQSHSPPGDPVRDILCSHAYRPHFSSTDNFLLSPTLQEPSSQFAGCSKWLQLCMGDSWSHVCTEKQFFFLISP